MAVYRVIWGCTGLYGVYRVISEMYEVIWSVQVYMGVYGVIWGCMGLYGGVQGYMGCTMLKNKKHFFK